ncbi:MAG: MBL fold metallo-hydrolase [Deltaproteobacteria bacterium]|nr:MBL fold metallo-hydrolase [Deltaproteobacteria bacterium]
MPAPQSTPLYRDRPGGFDIQPAHQSEARKILDGIYLSEGLSNSFLIVTPEGRVVINTGMGFEAPVHKRLYDAVDRSPLRYILLTQGHVDHVGGVDQLREPGTEIVAHANQASQQDDDERIKGFRAARSAFAFRDAIAKILRHARAHADEPVPAQSRPEATLTFDDRHAFELGGQRFELLSVPGGETADSMAIWLPDRKICFSGNLFSALFGHFPNLVTIRGDRYREAPRFIESLERVRALEPEWLMVGHGLPIRGRDLIQSELIRLRDAVEYVHAATVEGMNAHKDVHTLMREIQLPPELEVGEGYGKVSWSVRAIWETYAGWFHHRSTTELYAIPAEAIHGDLVELAGGPDAITARARQRLESGEPVEAIHLAEVVLSAAPFDRGALQVSIEAHARLDAESVNFWLSSWLREQGRSLGERLELAEKKRSEEGA